MIFNFLIMSITVSSLTDSSDIYFSLIPKVSTLASKYDLNVSFTSLSSETTLPSSMKVIFFVSLSFSYKRPVCEQLALEM